MSSETLTPRTDALYSSSDAGAGPGIAGDHRSSPGDVDTVLQHARLELWRDNVSGALEILEVAKCRDPHPLLAAQAEEIRSWSS